jgi:hypothetical protein
MMLPGTGPRKALDNILTVTVISAGIKGSSYQPEKRLTSGSSIRSRVLTDPYDPGGRAMDSQARPLSEAIRPRVKVFFCV